jgi:hypothetical protein
VGMALVAGHQKPGRSTPTRAFVANR